MKAAMRGTSQTSGRRERRDPCATAAGSDFMSSESLGSVTTPPDPT
jgi:hypothetical protein